MYKSGHPYLAENWRHLPHVVYSVWTNAHANDQSLSRFEVKAVIRVLRCRSTKTQVYRHLIQPVS